MHKRLVLAAILGLATVPLVARAQPADPPRAPREGADPRTAGGGAEPLPIPPAPVVDDAMLGPVPQAPMTVTTWEEALSLVRGRSTDLRIAYAEVKRAEAQTRIALAGTLPSLNASVSASHHFIRDTVGGTQTVNCTGLPTCPPSGFITTTSPTQEIPRANTVSAQITLTQPLFVPQVWHNIRTTEYAQEAASLTLEDLKRTIALNVASAIVGVVTAERIAELNRIGLRRALERYELTARKKALGGSTGLDVVRAQQDVEAARATLVTGDESLRQARESLGLALGIPKQVGVTRDVNLDGLEASARRICRITTELEERADIAAAKKRLTIARRNVDNVYWQFSPTVTAQSTVATSSANVSGPATTWNIQAVLSIPLWEGGARYGNLRIARVAELQAEQNLEALKRQAEVQIGQARRGVEVAEQSRKVAEGARALAAEVDRLTRVGWQQGTGTSLELVTAAAALRQADITLALREFDVTRARVLALLALATCPW